MRLKGRVFVLKDKEMLRDVIFELACADGTPGDETQAVSAAVKKLEKYMSVYVDTLGSVRGEMPGEGPHILLDAHIDRIGMIVTSVDDSGFIKFTKCGGTDARVLAAAEVTVWGKEPVYGVVTSTPPHLSKGDDNKKAKDFSELSIDVGMSAECAKKLVHPGDRVTVNMKNLELMGDRISCAALDDRAGVASILRCLELLEGKKHGCKLSVLFSVQEETGGSGAATGGFDIAPDEAIAVDVSFAMAPGLKPEKCAHLSKGTMIGYAPSLDYNISRSLQRIAEKKNIPYQYEVMGGKTGTNADELQISGKGVKMGLLSIPLRNMHTGAEIIDINDVEATAQLMAEYIIERGRSDA